MRQGGGYGAQSKERKGSNFAIWQPCSEFSTPSPRGKRKRIDGRHRSRSLKDENGIKTEPEEYNNEVAANLPSTTSNPSQNLKRPLGNDKPCPKSKKQKSMSADIYSQEHQTAKEGKKTRDGMENDSLATVELPSKEDGRNVGDIGQSIVTTDEIDTSEPSDAEKANCTADEGEGASSAMVARWL